jgi:hypothetical protein
VKCEGGEGAMKVNDEGRRKEGWQTGRKEGWKDERTDGRTKGRKEGTKEGREEGRKEGITVNLGGDDGSEVVPSDVDLGKEGRRRKGRKKRKG